MLCWHISIVPRLILSNRVIFHRGLTQTISQEFVSFPLRVLCSSFSPQLLLLLFLMTFKAGGRSLHVSCVHQNLTLVLTRLKLSWDAEVMTGHLLKWSGIISVQVMTRCEAARWPVTRGSVTIYQKPCHYQVTGDGVSGRMSKTCNWYFHKQKSHSFSRYRPPPPPHLQGCESCRDPVLYLLGAMTSWNINKYLSRYASPGARFLRKFCVTSCVWYVSSRAD